VAEGSRLTRKYFREIENIAVRKSSGEFYVLNEGDQAFYWHIDGGLPVSQFLSRPTTFRFAGNSEPLPMEALLSNSVNVVVPTWDGILDAIATKRFPRPGDPSLCAPIFAMVGGARECALFYAGRPVANRATSVAETPSGMPLFDQGRETVAISRTTLFLDGASDLRINAGLRVVPESTDGVTIAIYKSRNGGAFELLFGKSLKPGEQVVLNEQFAGSPDTTFVLRVGPGESGNETGDWLIWGQPPN
jgi:hypothetical protein